MRRAFDAIPVLKAQATVICLATGPSLTPDDVAYCRGKGVIVAINDAYRLAPWADVLYACDAKWWRWHQGVPEFTGRKYALEASDRRWPERAGIQVVRNTGERGLELNPTGLRHGRNSGYQAINLAVHLGARRVVLLGYDMQASRGGRSHYFGEHPDRSKPSFTACLAIFQTLVAPLRQLGIAIVNCTRETALDCFPRQSLREVL